MASAEPPPPDTSRSPASLWHHSCPVPPAGVWLHVPQGTTPAHPRGRGDDPAPHSPGPASRRTRLCRYRDPQQLVCAAAGCSARCQRGGAGCGAAAPEVGPAPRQSTPARPGAAVTACSCLSPAPFSLPGSVHAGGTDTAPRRRWGDEHQGEEQRGNKAPWPWWEGPGRWQCQHRTCHGVWQLLPATATTAADPRGCSGPRPPSQQEQCQRAGALCNRAGTAVTAPGDKAGTGAQTTRMQQRPRCCARLEKMTLGTATCSIPQTRPALRAPGSAALPQHGTGGTSSTTTAPAAPAWSWRQHAGGIGPGAGSSCLFPSPPRSFLSSVWHRSQAWHRPRLLRRVPCVTEPAQWGWGHRGTVSALCFSLFSPPLDTQGWEDGATSMGHLPGVTFPSKHLSHRRGDMQWPLPVSTGST